MTIKDDQSRTITPPVAKKILNETIQFNDIRKDYYHWMRGRNPDDWQAVLKNPELLDPDIRQHLEDENAYFKQYSQKFNNLTDEIFKELVGCMIPNDSTVPVRDGDWEYWKEFYPKGDYPVFMRRNLHTGIKKVYYDANKEKGDSKFFKLVHSLHSPNHKYMAYCLDREGSEYFTIRFREIETGKELPEELSLASYCLAWSKDSSYIYYIECDDNHRPKRVKCHILGTDPKTDTVTYEESDDSCFLSVEKCLSGEYIFINNPDMSSTEIRFLRSDALPGCSPTLIRKREKDIKYYVSYREGLFYIRTNDNQSTEFKIMTAPTDSFTKDHWVDVVPYDENVTIVYILTFKNYMVRAERKNALPSIVVSDYKGHDYTVDLPEEAYTAYPLCGYEYDTNKLQIEYQTLVHPGIVYQLDMDTREKSILKEKKLPNDHDPRHYIIERKFVKARDNKVDVPVTIARHKSTRLDGSAPLFQYGYGSYCNSIDSSFSSTAISLINRGIIYAVAHIRGGGELGEKWHLGGKKENKINTFTDFIDVTEALTNEGYGEKGKVCIEGRSAGGMLMGAVINMRPELYTAVLAGVPFVDVLNTISDASLPLTPPEWEEWGDPIHDKAAYDLIKSYSPYDNIKKEKTYPAILSTAGLTDYRVTYWEPAKWIARLREEVDGGPFFIKTEMHAGHAGSAARYEKIKERAPEYAFIIDRFKECGYDLSLCSNTIEK